MFCPKCGAKNDDGASFCSNCGNSLTPQPVHPAAPPPGAGYGMASIVPNYMVQAILVTLFCCLPFGIVAIVKASQVSKQQALGSYAGALAASNDAKLWCWVSFGCGIAVFLIYMMLVVAGLSTGTITE
jgi:hypothetical protein